MADSLQTYQESNSTHGRVCDFCSESTALLYCKADSAKLCLSCDRVVHSTNQLFTKHTRFQLCDNCDCSAASIYCSTEKSVLCQNCDFEIHNVCFSRHDRRPIEGFSGCPSDSELQGFLGFQDFIDEKEGFLEEESDGFLDWIVWDTPAIVSIDELILETGSTHNFQAMVVPPLPKDRNLSCGKHKQEILHQLSKLRKSDPNSNSKQDSTCLLLNPVLGDQIEEEDFTIDHMLQHYQPDNEFSSANDAVNDIFLSSALFESHNEEAVPRSDHRLDSHDVINVESLVCTQKVLKVEVSSADRDSAISRYKEKRRTRRYEKHIRYESRKAQAENRTRLRGRFAKGRPPTELATMTQSGNNR